MQSQLRLLEELQRFDARLQEFDAANKTLPEKLDAMKRDLARVTAMLDKERADLAEIEKFRRDLELQLKSDSESISKAKAKLSQSKTGKDYNAANREIEATRKMHADREEELIRLMAAIETGKKSVAAHEKDVAELRAVVEREEADTQAKLAEVNGKVAAERAERDRIAAQVRPDILKKYGTIKMRRGLAVVPVAKNGACAGCHMTIPPQALIILQRGTTIETCQHCNRIIYWPKVVEDKQLERGEEV